MRGPKVALSLLLFAIQVLDDRFDDEVVDRSIDSLPEMIQSLDRLLVEFALRYVNGQRRHFALPDHWTHLLSVWLEVPGFCVSLQQSKENRQVHSKVK